MMTVAAPEKTAHRTSAVEPFSLRDTPALIEKAWPTAKISAETQKERKAVHGQTLTGLGSYWKGRKPLILTRACVLASLMPATEDLERDVEIFEKLMGMADETFGRRFVESPAAFDRLFPGHASKVIDDTGRSLRWRDDLSDSERQRRISSAFMELPYARRLDKVKRPEEIAERVLLDGVWTEVNAHLGTDARSISELIEQLGIMRFGRRPQFADAFSGSGSIPFEAARIGCDVFASDLNPIACMLTWGAFHMIGATPDEHQRMLAEQRRISSDIDRFICELGIEHDFDGNRAKVFLFCIEAKCPRTEWMVPMAPSWVLSRQRNVIARLIPDHQRMRYDIEIVTVSSDEEMQDASHGTIQNGRLVHTMLGDQLGAEIGEIRGDGQDDEGNNQNALRRWEKSDFEPRPGDIYQERLYAIQWMDAADLAKGKTRPKTWLAAPSEEDFARETKVREIVSQNFSQWQRSGFVPDMEITSGYNTSQLIRERGWAYWHQLFSPRHLLTLALLREQIAAVSDPEVRAALEVAFCRSLDFVSKLTQWMTRNKTEKSPGDVVNHVFYNQAFNTFWNYGARATMPLLTNFTVGKPSMTSVRKGTVTTAMARDVSVTADIWITDPPYADSINYDEITEYFIAWLRKNPPGPFAQWIWDSRRSLAIRGDGQPFKSAMIEAYKAMTDHMSPNGLQIVQFTHQDARTWSDMAQIFWGAGLQVIQDWYVSTEAESSVRKGGYVQGTHMIVLKKRQRDQSGYQDEIVHEIRDEVERQIKEMIGLNDQMDAARGENIFNDADLQMAGYAAALRVLTAYTKIDGKDMTQEALRPRKKGEKTLVDELTEFAVQTANEFLVPDGLERELWLDLNGAERFYLKMMDIEEVGEAKLDQFQNFAKAFRVGDYDDMMASKSPNNAKLKTATKLGKTSMAEGIPFGRDSIVRLALRAIWRVGKDDEVEDVLEELRDFIPDYLRKRDALRQIIAYVAAKRERTEPEEASAARILGTAIQTERI